MLLHPGAVSIDGWLARGLGDRVGPRLGLRTVNQDERLLSVLLCVIGR
jgi:hypothetical protein